MLRLKRLKATDKSWKVGGTCKLKAAGPKKVAKTNPPKYAWTGTPNTATLMDKEDAHRMKGTATQKKIPCTCAHYWSFSSRKWLAQNLTIVIPSAYSIWRTLWRPSFGTVVLHWCFPSSSLSSTMAHDWLQYSTSMCNLHHTRLGHARKMFAIMETICESTWALVWWKLAPCYNTKTLYYLYYNPTRILCQPWIMLRVLRSNTSGNIIEAMLLFQYSLVWQSKVHSGFHFSGLFRLA